MSRIIALLLLAGLAGCETIPEGDRTAIPQGKLVSLEVFHSMRITAQRVKVTMHARHLDVEIEDRDKPVERYRKPVDPADAAHIHALLQDIDWQRIASDDVRGLDGTAVRTVVQGETYAVWTPSHQTRRRKLGDYVRLKNELFELAGLEPSGLRQ